MPFDRASIRLTDYLTKQVTCQLLFFDGFIKGLDTIDYTILLSNINLDGMCGFENNMLGKYLSDRYQYIVYHGCKLITTGVPGLHSGETTIIIYL